MIDYLIDSMLGKLAKFLRIIGYNAIYNPNLEDRETLSISKFHNYVLITRDKNLFSSSVNEKIIVILLDDNAISYNLFLLNIIVGLNLRISYEKTRCPKCNNILRHISKDKIRNILPSYIISKYNKFFVCDNCSKIYWDGYHIDKLNNILLIAKNDVYAYKRRRKISSKDS